MRVRFAKFFGELESEVESLPRFDDRDALCLKLSFDFLYFLGQLRRHFERLIPIDHRVMEVMAARVQTDRRTSNAGPSPELSTSRSKPSLVDSAVMEIHTPSFMSHHSSASGQRSDCDVMRSTGVLGTPRLVTGVEEPLEVHVDLLLLRATSEQFLAVRDPHRWISPALPLPRFRM